MDKRSYKTKQALAESLKTLMEKQKFEKISIESICNLADVNRRNFYRHFLDKYDLLNWIVQEDFSFDFDRHPEWTIVDYFPMFCERTYQNRQFYQKVLPMTGQNGFRENFFNWMFPLLKRSTEDYSLTKEMEERWLRSMTYIAFDSLEAWLLNRPGVSPETFARQFQEEIFKMAEALKLAYDRPYPEENVRILEEEDKAEE